MKRHMIVKGEVLKKVLDCFCTQDEFQDFLVDMGGLMNELNYSGQTAWRDIDNKELGNLMAMKQVFLMGQFCKDNIEVIRDLIRVVEYTEKIPENMKKDEGWYENGDNTSPRL